MKLADKPCYPCEIVEQVPSNSTNGFVNIESYHSGLTFRERLIIALARNPSMIIQFAGNDDRLYPYQPVTAKVIIEQADAIIKEMEK